MSAQGGASTAGASTPSNEGTNGVEVLESTTDAERILDVGIETTSVSIRAPSDNAGDVFLGFDEDVDSSDGYPLEPGDAISLDIDISNAPMFAIPNNANDEVRFLAID